MQGGNFLKIGKNYFLKVFLFPAIFLSGFFVLFFTPLSIDFRLINFTKAATEINSESINTDTTWTLANSPYIINPLYISINATLTIEPGVIIKMDRGNFVVNGELIARGTKNQPIIFTSINDDEVGGRAVPWSSGNPLPGDWGAIEVRDGLATLDNVEIKYGGETCVYEVRAKPIKLSTAYAGFCYNTPVISGGRIAINNSKINNNKIGLGFYGGDQIEINNSEIYNNQEYGLINFSERQLTASNNWWGDDSGPHHETLNPAGLGDKILGDVLFDPWIGKTVAPKLNPVILIPGFFGSWKVSDKMELDPIMHTYDNLWEALRAAGYEKDKTLFAFPYNWRQSNATTSKILAEKILDVKNICVDAALEDYDCSMVDLVAHSMGGLIARAYIEGDKYLNDVDQLIFLATPQRGAPMAYLSWEGGESGIKFKDFVIEKIFLAEAHKLGYPNNFFYIRDLPMLSVKELLPIYDYLRDKGEDSLRRYFFDYPRNEFLEDLNNPYNLARLQEVKILNILADAGASSTMSAFRVVDEDYADGRWEHGYPENYGRLFTDHGLEYGTGDNTVPYASNSNFNRFDEILIGSSSHLSIVSDAQKLIIKELTGNDQEKEIKKNIIKKILMVRIFSPAEFVIISPDGKKLGKDFNEVDGAYYAGDFATIPNPLDGEYQIELNGTGNGEYKLSISAIDEATSTDKEFSGQIKLNESQSFKINYSSSSLELLNDLKPQDCVVPEIIINSPVDKSIYLHSEKFLIDYKTSDDFSGVASTSVKIDDIILSTTTIDLFGYSLGTHTIIIITSDKAGNSTEKQIVFVIKANIDSLVSDINRVYKNSWLIGELRKNLLIDELKILASALILIDKEKQEALKQIESIKNNPILSKAVKNLLISGLNKKIAILNESRVKAIKLNLGFFEATLNEAKKSNSLNQLGYDIIKNSLEYLKNNL